MSSTTNGTKRPTKGNGAAADLTIEIDEATVAAVAPLQAQHAALGEKIVALCEHLAKFGALPGAILQLVQERAQCAAAMTERLNKAALLRGVDVTDPSSGSWRWDGASRSLRRTEP